MNEIDAFDAMYALMVHSDDALINAMMNALMVHCTMHDALMKALLVH